MRPVKTFGSISVLRGVVEARTEAAKQLIEKLNECDCGELVEKPATRCEGCAETYTDTAVHLQAMTLQFN